MVGSDIDFLRFAAFFALRRARLKCGLAKAVFRAGVLTARNSPEMAHPNPAAGHCG
jgi:hypothetical protein